MNKHGLALPCMACSQASKPSTWKDLITSNELTPCPGQVSTFSDCCSPRSRPHALGATALATKGQSAGRCWEIGSDIYYFPNLSWLCLPSRKNVVLILLLVRRNPPITSCWRLPGSQRALCGMTKAEARAQKDLIPCF